LSALPTELVFDLVARYGYALVFILGILEALPLVGVLAPGHATIILSGVAAAAGLLNVYVVIALAVVAGVIGDAIGFWVSRRYGQAFLDKYGSRLRITPAAVAKSNAVFEKYGPFALVIVRFSFVARSVGPLLAGMSKMPWRTFWIYNVLGAILWGVGNVLAGYFFGVAFIEVQGALGRVLAYTALAVVGVFVLYRALKRFAGFTRGDFLLALLAAGAGAAFGLIADRVTDVGTANGLDARMPEITSLFAALAPAFRWVDVATHFAVLAAIAIVLFGALLYRRRAADAGLVALGLGGIIALAQALQPAFDVPQGIGHADFPSSHAAIPVVLAGVVTYLLATRGHKRWAWTAAVGGGVLVLLASVSRMAQGQEYPTAVLAGAALGTAWLAVSLLLVEFLRKRRGQPSGAGTPPI